MHRFEIESRLHQILKKLFKKDKKTYEIIYRKINEIINSPDIEHYKNLKHPLNNFKRVHIGHFVLLFRYIKKENKVQFIDFDHHDNIYKSFA